MAGRSELLDLLQQRRSPVLSHRRAKQLWTTQSHRSGLFNWKVYLPFCPLPLLLDGAALPQSLPQGTPNPEGSQGKEGSTAVNWGRAEAAG